MLTRLMPSLHRLNLNPPVSMHGGEGGHGAADNDDDDDDDDDDDEWEDAGGGAAAEAARKRAREGEAGPSGTAPDPPPDPMANTTFAITTVMATGQVNHQINLELLARLNAHYCSFEPERQRFAIWRAVTRGQVNVFTSGKLVMNGYKTEAECREAFAIVVAKIREPSGGRMR